MIYLNWLGEGWRYSAGIVTARFDSGAVIEIPVGRSRRGAFYLMRSGEHEWRIAPVKFPKNRPESYDGDGHFNDFICLTGGPDGIHRELDQI